MINRWVGMGRLTAKPELKKTTSGTAVCSFTIAIDRDRQRDKADFISCVAWAQTAEFICNYFEKGRLIAVNGELHNREWTDTQGRKHSVCEVNVDRVWFCGDKPKDTKTTYDEIGDDDAELPWA